MCDAADVCSSGWEDRRRDVHQAALSQNGLWIGADQDSVGGGWEAGNYYHGSIDDVRIYDRALSAEEVQVLYNLGQ